MGATIRKTRVNICRRVAAECKHDQVWFTLHLTIMLLVNLGDLFLNVVTRKYLGSGEDVFL